MRQELRETVQAVLASAPCSIELPAGTGKTQILAAAAAVASWEGDRVLVLTHTNAGVDAIRRRIKQFSVPPSSVCVDTIVGWAFRLARAYEEIGGIPVSIDPNWDESEQYIHAAIRVAKSRAVRDVHHASFNYLIVDEFQDCTLIQHELVLALCEAIPKAIVLGDRLQAIFGWAGALVDWNTHVTPSFPEFVVETVPHRWVDHNRALGEWLLAIRPNLVSGRQFDFSHHQIPGLTWAVITSRQTIADVALSFVQMDESVVLLDKWAPSVAEHASNLHGVYKVMEDMGGKFMRDQLNTLPGEGEPHLAKWLANFAKTCAIGLGSIDRVILTRLENNQSIAGYSRPGLAPALVALEALRTNPTYSELQIAADVLRNLNGVRLYRWEAWNDALSAVRLMAECGEEVEVCLARVRERLRKTGRRTQSRVASRTLLVKGLEFDHVIVADIAQFRDPRNLYVALSRARKSVTILGTHPGVQLANGA